LEVLRGVAESFLFAGDHAEKIRFRSDGAVSSPSSLVADTKSSSSGWSEEDGDEGTKETVEDCLERVRVGSELSLSFRSSESAASLSILTIR